jgi:hypothetical protein
MRFGEQSAKDRILFFNGQEPPSKTQGVYVNNEYVQAAVLSETFTD